MERMQRGSRRVDGMIKDRLEEPAPSLLWGGLFLRSPLHREVSLYLKAVLVFMNVGMWVFGLKKCKLG
jgi:hypothetical protein